MKLKNVLMTIAVASMLTAPAMAIVPQNGQNEEVLGTESQMISPAYLLIGDSRFVGMESTVGSPSDTSVIWVDKVGAGNHFYFENESTIADLDRDTVVIYELGVNDLDATACIDALTRLRDAGFRSVWFSTVGPVDDAKMTEYGYVVRNAMIVDFNAKVLAKLPDGVGVVDSYGFLTRNGFGSRDGLHYDAPTYQNWFQYLLEHTANSPFTTEYAN